MSTPLLRREPCLCRRERALRARVVLPHVGPAGNEELAHDHDQCAQEDFAIDLREALAPCLRAYARRGIAAHREDALELRSKSLRIQGRCSMRESARIAQSYCATRSHAKTITPVTET